jgi:hypothetical protein
MLQKYSRFTIATKNLTPWYFWWSLVTNYFLHGMQKILSAIDPGSAVLRLKKSASEHASARHQGTEAKQFASCTMPLRYRYVALCTVVPPTRILFLRIVLVLASLAHQNNSPPKPTTLPQTSGGRVGFDSCWVAKI